MGAKTMFKYAMAALLVGTPAAASAQAIITNGTIGLGVDTAGQLNVSGPASSGGVTFYGLRDVASNREATAAGCLCEGWGAAIAGTGTTVYANNSVGSSFTPVSFTSTATTATSVVRSTDGRLQVTHAYAPSVSQYLYQASVTITNLSATALTGATLYRRAIDWDVEPTAFSEYSTIQGTAGAANVVFSSNDGFASTNPFSGPSSNGATGDFIDYGPDDTGALFDFSFAPLGAGASQTLNIFYGGAPTEALALGALGQVGAEVYSFGQAAGDKTGGNGTTFIFGFQGVGGTALPDPTAAVPEPASWAMMMIGFGAVGGSLRRRRTMQRPAIA